MKVTNSQMESRLNEETFTKFAEYVIGLKYSLSSSKTGTGDTVGSVDGLSGISFADAEVNGDKRTQTFDCNFTVDGEVVSGTITFTWEGFEDYLKQEEEEENNTPQAGAYATGGSGSTNDDTFHSSAKGYYTLDRDRTESEKEVLNNGHEFCSQVTQKEIDDGTYRGCCKNCLEYVRAIYSALNKTEVEERRYG